MCSALKDRGQRTFLFPRRTFAGVHCVGKARLLGVADPRTDFSELHTMMSLLGGLPLFPPFRRLKDTLESENQTLWSSYRAHRRCQDLPDVYRRPPVEPYSITSA